MGILRTDVVSHSSLESTGSVAFDGTTDYLTIPASVAWYSGAANSTVKKSFTVEWWQYWNAVSGYVDLLDVNYNSGLLIEANAGKYSVSMPGNSAITEATAAVTGQWYHYALVFYAGDGVSLGHATLYRDGEISASGKVDGNVVVGNASTVISIGAKQSNGAYSLNGYISNFRWCDRAVYNAPFTPPKFELTAIAGTQLLCCQSSSSATEAAVSPGTITASGNAAASAFAPDLKKDITDAGVVLEDNTKFDTLSYMVPPGGTTTESNRGRAVLGGGTDGSSDYMKTIDYFSIPSQGNSITFGDLSYATRNLGACSSSTRGLFAGGMGPASEVATNSISYITIATTANGSDFGDLSVVKRQFEGLSNQTRGIWPGGQNDTPSSNTEINSIDYVTIATTGNASDFGDIQEAKESTSTCASSTRGLIAGGDDGPAYSNTIGYITIATTGNAINFGDLSLARSSGTGCSNETRGLFFGGRVAPNNYNTIEYVTIATTGNSSNFGDLTVTINQTQSAASQIRGVLAGGNASPATVNLMEYVNIASTGDSSDFGDTTAIKTRGGTSDCHGGLS